MKREFTGVFIPAHIWTSKELIPAEKMILGEIDALSKTRGYCDASRAHFAEWLSCTVQNITYYFEKLERLGFIKVEKMPGYRSKIRLISERFYTEEGVSPTDGGSKPHLRVGVNGTDGGGKRDLPEIKDKKKKKEKDIYTQPTENKPQSPHSPKIETADEARTAINAWLNDGNEETVKLWYSELKINYNRGEFKTVLIKFCSNYMTSSDEGFVQRFQKDPVKFFRNRFQIFLPTCRGFDVKQSAKPAPSQSRAVYTPPAKRF